MCFKENWNVSVLWQIVRYHSNDVLQPHDKFYHVNPLRIDVDTPISNWGDELTTDKAVIQLSVARKIGMCQCSGRFLHVSSMHYCSPLSTFLIMWIHGDLTLSHLFSIVKTTWDGYQNGSYFVRNMSWEEDWNVSVLLQVVICHPNDVLQPHNNFNHVNPLTINIDTPFSYFGD